MIPDRPRARLLLALLGVLTAVHLGIQWFEIGTWSRPTQVLLMPVLAAFLLSETTRPRSRLTGLVLLALGLSWLGDSAPALVSGDTAFLAMVGFFLAAQVVYIAAFWPLRGGSALHRRRPLLVLYVAAVAALVVFCGPGSGAMLVPVLVYGLCLGAMAVLSTGVHRWAGLGGALFLVSDGLIALGAFAPGFDLPHSGFWVMLTYVLAQALIVFGVLARPRPAKRDEPTVSPPTSRDQ